jgi:peptide/nickel transport system permease protein
MGVGSPEELDNPDTAVIFWTRFWQDRALDFRPTVVKRLVRRLTQRGLELRRDDIIELDTYALPELIDAMPKVQRAAEVRAAERLTTIASHVTGKNWRISPNSTPAQADLVVRRWRDWWAVHRPEYVRLDGPRRVIATVTETRYGRWVGEAVRHRFGRTAHGQPVLDVFRERLPTTLWLIAFALLGGCAGGIVLGTAAARSGRRFDLITSLVTVAVAAVPAAAVAAWFGPKSPSSGWLAALTMLVMGVALLSRHQRAVALRRGRIQLEAQYASGGDRWRGAAALARQASTGLISLLGTELPVVLTSAFLFEKAFGLRGLGSVTFDALHSGDVTWLMALALSGAASVALMQIASDALLQAVDPKIQLSLLAKRETAP